MTGDLPRLAVVGDVPPCRTQGGPLLLYRLLAGYPAERLRVVYEDSNPMYVDPARFLAGVGHRRFAYGPALPRALRSRAFPLWKAAEQALAGRLAGRLADAVGDFRPEAVLALVDARLWVPAAAVARRMAVPLLLILHDDHPSKVTGNSPRLPARLDRWLLDRGVRAAYRQAAARFCVSPGMARRYEARYGRPATVLYPSRGEDSPEPRVRVNPALAGRPPVVAFAGALYTEGARDLLRQTAGRLAAVGGELHLYTRNDPAAFGLDRPGVRVAGFLPPAEMAERMAATAHALFLPASFLPAERVDVATLFPSKLADYTAVGLPVLIWGPADSSAAEWGRENPDAAVLVTDPAGAGVTEALGRFAADPAWATAKAAAAVAAGKRDFDGAAARQKLYATLRAAGGAA